MDLDEFGDGELKVLGEFSEVLVVLFIKYEHELFDDEYVEVADFVFEDVDALVFGVQFASNGLERGSALRHIYIIIAKTIADTLSLKCGHLFAHDFLREFCEFAEVLRAFPFVIKAL